MSCPIEMLSKKLRRCEFPNNVMFKKQEAAQVPVDETHIFINRCN
jgi:hypothetical protein